MNQSLEGHADHRFDGELSSLHLLILKMGGLTLNQSQLSLQAILQQDIVAAQTVIGKEPDIDSLEATVDSRIVELISKRSPIAKDLRITMAFSKIVVDLEHVADEAAKIATIVLILNDGNPKLSKRQTRDIASMGKLSVGYLETAIQAFDTLDVKLANSILNAELELNEEFQSALRYSMTFVLEDARTLGNSINIMLMLKSLERIGTHAQNIAEYVIYVVHGINIHHQRRATDKKNGN